MKIKKVIYVLDDEDRKQIKKQMIDLDLSFRQLAKQMGYSVSYVCQIFNGEKNVTKEFIEKLFNVGINLDIDYVYFIDMKKFLI